MSRSFLGLQESRVQPVALSEIRDCGVSLAIKREDELHPVISGNKYRKLAYNLEEAARLQQTTLLTFGGAYSNHIAAVAGAGATFGFKTIGLIRGDELAADPVGLSKSNPTLAFASEQGMTCRFVSRSVYRQKTSRQFISGLRKELGDFYLVPEGGTNRLAVKGCEEILSEADAQYGVICAAVGTGGTLSGIINSLQPGQRALGFPALKGDFLTAEIQSYVQTTDNWCLQTGYHFGGFAKISKELVTFINAFKQETGIPLDPVYTGKMMFGLVDLIKKGAFAKGTRILAIHTGGLQGIAGMNLRLAKKNGPLIHIE
ncbi:MAG: pyridoxal-phosphate dependent enzyme [Lutibacter sp.]|jgi:1-aminocyclopropane-1-carboxylate deaminase|nr:pyridoxal-phosphate dependent enzyme [Lutibacter sp.]